MIFSSARAEIGKQTGLKIQRDSSLVGSSPTERTKTIVFTNNWSLICIKTLKGFKVVKQTDHRGNKF